jgi:hypothetical protein
MARTWLVYIVILLAYGCMGKLSNPRLKEGKIQSTTEYPKFTDSTFANLESKTEISAFKWYNGDLVIDEKVQHYTQTENEKTTQGLKVTGYVFMDYKTRKAAEYAEFSDTAKPLQIFNLYDNVRLREGNIHSGDWLDTSTLSRNIYTLPDTSIENIVYKRAVRVYTHDMQGNPRNFIQIYYFRRDLSEDLGRIYFWQDSLTKAMRAPIVWVEERKEANSPQVLAKARLKFIADTLTPTEKKVFSAWHKNMER